ncbi:MAG TPA: hypothetical protein VM327_06920 [Candidatus Thermoplasmatota archaeon]|nr:hypothetical protein [Candidatus Thermoplasmatota archaeon]
MRNPEAAFNTALDVYVETLAANGQEIDFGRLDDQPLTFQPGTLSSVSLTPESNVAGVVTNYTIEFTTEHDFPPNGIVLAKLETVSPDFRARLDRTPVVTGCTFPFQAFPVGTSAPRKNVQIQSGDPDAAGPRCAPGPKSFVVHGITNPPAGTYPVTAGTISTRGRDRSTTAEIDVMTDNAVPIIITPATLSLVSWTPGSTTPGATTTQTLAFTANRLPGDGKVVVDIGALAQSGFGLTDLAPQVTATGCTSGTFSVERTGQVLTIKRTDGSVCFGAMGFTFRGIQNPSTAGTYSLSGPGTVTTRSASGAIYSQNPDSLVITVTIGDVPASPTPTASPTPPPPLPPQPSEEDPEPTQEEDPGGESSPVEATPVSAGEQAAAVRLVLSPPTVTVAPGQSQIFQANLTDSRGNPLSTARVVLAITNGTCVGFVCTAESPGQHVVTATSGELFGIAMLTVTEPAVQRGSPEAPFWAIVGLLGMLAILVTRGGRRG